MVRFFECCLFALSLLSVYAIHDRNHGRLTADPVVDLTGWTLVRRVKAGPAWHPAKDSALGTQSYGTPTTDPTANVTFSLKYDTMDFDQMLFATGDNQRWVIVSRAQVAIIGGSLFLADILSSHVSDKQYQVKWYNRGATVVEDPWISARDHTYGGASVLKDNDVHSMLYGENGYSAGWNYWIKNRNGANVFVRKAPYNGVDLSGWKLVRRVKAGETWHPAKDNCAGTESYGTPSDFQSSNTFSVKFNTEDFNQYLFATGDGTKWIIVSRAEVAHQGGSLYEANIISSFVNDKPYQAKWYNRAGTPGDPWISVNDHNFAGTSVQNDNDVNSMLYGEASYKGWNNWIINHNGANVFIRKVAPAYAGVDLSGWKLVRRVKAGETWHPAKDNVAGTESYGTPSDFQSDNTFSVKFDTEDFNQYLFATGDGLKWVITSRAEVAHQGGSLYAANIIASFVNDKPYQAKWYNRAGVAEDPWISANDHNFNGTSVQADNEVNSMVYGEASYKGWNYWIRNHNGANVFIRKVAPAYAGVDLTGWKLVRRVKAGETWHPAKDNAAGTEVYGTPSDFQSDNTFSIKFNTEDFNQYLFATGDGLKWVIASRAEVAHKGGSLYAANIIASFVNDKPYQAKWYNRAGSPGDPWISANDHNFNGTSVQADNEVNSMVYGEASYKGWSYWIRNHNGANVFIRKATPSYQGVDLTGWKLVRRVKAGDAWHPAKDNVAGTDVYGTPSDFQSDNTFSVKFDNLDFNQLLFATGDGLKWVIASRAEVAHKGGSQYLANIIASFVSDKPYQAKWYNRAGVAEDPWVSAHDHNFNGTSYLHDNEVNSMLYAENGYAGGWNYWIRNHNGANVFIRKVIPDYNGVDLSGWKLVRRVKAGDTWHPAKDNCAGTEVYGTPSDFQSDSTFSIKFDNLDFNQFLFATGDGTKWVIASRAQVATKGGPNFLAKIIASDVSSTPYQARWYNRVAGFAEDPWISSRDHTYGGSSAAKDSDAHSMLYGEASYRAWNWWIRNHNGANVFVRKVGASGGENEFIPPPPVSEAGVIPPVSEGGVIPPPPVSESGVSESGFVPPPPNEGGYAPSESGYAPSESGYAPSEAGYAPSEAGYAPNEAGYGYVSEAGYAPPSESGYVPPPPPPPSEGGYAPPPPSEGGYGYTSEGGYAPPPPPPSEGGYGYTSESSYVPPPPSYTSENSYVPPPPNQGGYVSESSYVPPPPTTGGYTPAKKY